MWAESPLGYSPASMKKLLIGCGCGGLILLAAGLAFIGVQAYPIYKEIEEQGSRYDAKIELLDQALPGGE